MTLTAATLNLCKTEYCKFKEDGYFTVVHCIGNYFIYGMSGLAFFAVRWTTPKCHNAKGLARYGE